MTEESDARTLQSSPGGAKKSRRGLIYLGILGALALLAWRLFHPELRPDINLVSSAVREELTKAGFTSTKGVTAVRFKTSENIDGQDGELSAQQTILAIDRLLTEKRTQRRANASVEESIGLYVGPIAVVRLSRNRPPIIGGVLPYHFWMSSRMTEFSVEQNDQFPHVPGGVLLAKVTYEETYADGKLAQSERISLRCEISRVVQAASIDAGLSGKAARVDCKESLERGGRQVGEANPGSYFFEDIKFSHWYIFDLGWSLPIEGEQQMRMNDATIVRKWSTTLVSYQ